RFPQHDDTEDGPGMVLHECGGALGKGLRRIDHITESYFAVIVFQFGIADHVDFPFFHGAKNGAYDELTEVLAAPSVMHPHGFYFADAVWMRDEPCESYDFLLLARDNIHAIIDAAAIQLVLV